MITEMVGVTMTTDEEEDDEEKLWNITDKLVDKFYKLGKECIFLSVDEENLQYRSTKMGSRFLTSNPKWSKDFKDFCVNLYSADLASIQVNDTENLDDDAGDDCFEISDGEEEMDVKPPASKMAKFTIIKSGRTRTKLKLGPKNIPSLILKKEKDDDWIAPKPILKEKFAVSETEKVRKQAATRRPSNQSLVCNTRNQTEKLMVDEILKSKETCLVRLEKLDLSVLNKKKKMTGSGNKTEGLKGDNRNRESRKSESDSKRKEKDFRVNGSNSDNEIDDQESLEEVQNENVVASEGKCKARLNAKDRLNNVHPDLRELHLYLSKLNYVCKICSKEYDNNISYYNHIRAHKDVQHCKICDVFIPKDPGSMEKHMAEKHADRFFFKCLKCEHKFKSKVGLKNHFISNHAKNDDRFRCKNCGAQFGNLANLQRHERIHEFENSCFICLKKIDTKEELKHHMKEVHSYYFCTTCSLYFVDHVVLEEHEQTHLSQPELGSNTTSLADTNSTSGTEIENTSNQHEQFKQEVNMSDEERDGTKIMNEDFLNEKREMIEKLDTDLDQKDKALISGATKTKEETLEYVQGSENENSTKAGEINTDIMYNKSMDISTQASELAKSTKIDSNRKTTEAGENKKSTKPSEIQKSTEANEIQKSTDLSENQKNCKFCGKIFKQRYALLRHMKLHNNKSNFACEHCGKISKTDETYKRHMLLHLPNDEKPYKCDVCGKGFVTRTGLTIHGTVHNEDNTFICEYCGKGFKCPRQLKIHNRKHTGEEPYQCTECGKKFRSWDMLNCHEIIHKPKSVICDVCGKVFAHRLRLRAHKKSHDKVGRYMCMYCKIRFKTHGCLNSHYVSKHLDYAKSRGWLLYQCEHCDKVFPSKEKYHRHIRTHTGEKPYKCDICGKSFAENGNLNAHIKIHTNDKPHECTYCDKRFIHNRTLRKHLLIHEQPGNQHQTGDLHQEKPDERCQENPNPKRTGSTKDQLLALSIVAGSQNYLAGIGNKEPVAEKKIVQTNDDPYVIVVPEGHVFQSISEHSVERTPLLPARFSEESSVSSRQVLTSSVNYNEPEYVQFSQQSGQMTSGQLVQPSPIRLAHQTKRINIEHIQQAPKMGHITEQQAHSNNQLFIDPRSYTEHLTSNSGFSLVTLHKHDQNKYQ